MLRGGKKLSQETLEDIRKRAVKLAESGDRNAAWKTVAPILKVQSRDRDAAKTLLKIIDLDCLSHEHALAALEAIDSKHGSDVEIVSLIGENLDNAINTRFLNAAPADHPIFLKTIAFLKNAWKTGDHTGSEAPLLDGLATAARILGRQSDKLAEQAYKRLIQLDPQKPYRHYNYGLFLKTRGRFEEGARQNAIADELSSEPDEAIRWNLGICATGAGQGDIALKTWKEMGHNIEMGRFGLPEGGFPQCKIRLAERPLAERTSDNDDPGEEETIWIERLSACHGIVRSVLYNDLGVNYGDVVLFDGAPITSHKYDDQDIFIFPHLATLLRRNYQFFDFAGTQDGPARLLEVNSALAEDAVLYSHSENFTVLCANCWNDPDKNHARHEEVTKHVVTGRIAAPPDMDPRELLAQLDAGLGELAPCRIFSPELCRSADQRDRARIEQRRFDMLSSI